MKHDCPSTIKDIYNMVEKLYNIAVRHGIREQL